MTKHILLVASDPAPEAEERYNEFLTNEHLPDVLTVDGFLSARRFRLADQQPDIAASVPRQRYLHIYEIEAADLDDAFAKMTQARQAPTWHVSGGCVSSDQIVAAYTAFGDVILPAS